MKLLLVTDAWSPQINGVVRTLQAVVRGLEAKGWEVKVVHPGLFKSFPLPGYREIRIAWDVWRLKDIIKETGNEYATLASEGIDAGDVTNFVDTGCYSLNALLSGSIYGGMPANKITAIAGESATGKTFFACLLYTSPSPRDQRGSGVASSA